MEVEGRLSRVRYQDTVFMHQSLRARRTFDVGAGKQVQKKLVNHLTLAWCKVDSPFAFLGRSRHLHHTCASRFDKSPLGTRYDLQHDVIIPESEAYRWSMGIPDSGPA